MSRTGTRTRKPPNCATGPVDLLLALVVLLVFAAVGWWLRDRLPAPRRRRGAR